MGRVISWCKVTIIPMTETSFKSSKNWQDAKAWKALSSAQNLAIFCLTQLGLQEWIMNILIKTESDDDYTNGNNHEKIIYDYEEVEYESNNEEEGKQDAEDDNQVI